MACAGWLEDAAKAKLGRVGTAGLKYWVCKRAPAAIYEAMECHGGNGYVEEGPMPRIFRQSPLNSIWEGSGNVQVLDVLRALAREQGVAEAFVDELQAGQGITAAFDENIARVSESVIQASKDPQGAMESGRALVDRMAVSLQASLMKQYGSVESAEAFCASRCGVTGASSYGAYVPVNIAGTIVNRTSP